jgi:uncharacterized protein YjgD (DUF1641 family)
MAKPTNVIARPAPTPEQERAAGLETLLEGASDHSSALLEGLALLQSLHERGILEALTALAQQGDAALGVAMDTLSSQPAYSQGARNALTLAGSLGALDEPTMEQTQRMVTSGLRAFAAAQPPARPYGFFDLLRELKDPDVSAGLAATIALLKGIGAERRRGGQ